MKCYKGKIITVNQNNDCFNFLVEDKGKIIFVGNDLPKEYHNIECIDLKNECLIPAFVDTHQHFASLSTFYAGLNVMNANSNQEILEMISNFVQKQKNKILLCFGASPYSVREKKLITREELDSVCKNKELMVVKYDGHACVINSKLLKKLNNKLKNLRGYHSDTGEMNQEAFFICSNYISNCLSIKDLFVNMQNCVNYLAKQGIGMVHSVSGVGFIGNLDITIEKIFAKSLNNGFQMRIFPQSLNVKVAKKRKIKRIGGCFECALDGCLGSKDAALYENYNNDATNGILYYSDEKVINFCKKANRLGLQIELHAIGDRAFDQATTALKAALDDFPRKDHRHGIIHACLPTENGMKVCKEYHIQLPIQTAFIDWKQEPIDYLKSILGEERTYKLNPVKTFLNNGIILSFGSDSPCTNPNPIEWIDKAVNNENLDARIDIKDALKMCTYNGYYTTFDEKERGSLEVGKIADMVILSDDIYTINKEKIKNVSVKKLILGGKDYIPTKYSLFKQLFKGLFSNNKF